MEGGVSRGLGGRRGGEEEGGGEGTFACAGRKLSLI